MNTAICDTSSLIRLTKGEVIFCLEKIFDNIYIPKAVEQECADPETKKALTSPIFEVRSVKNILPIGLGVGEREAISLAVEMNIETIIIDDEKAFRKASQQGLKPLKSINILNASKQLGIIQSIAPILDLMKSKGEGIEDRK